MKLWAGRFTKSTDGLVDDFNSSIHFDKRLYECDIKGSIAHANMLEKIGVLTSQENRLIVNGLTEIKDELERGQLELHVDAEDIHMNIETILTEKIGPVGKKLHTGRSRNDQVTLDLRMYLKQQIRDIQALIKQLIDVFVGICEQNKQTILPGYTHLQMAQPVTLAQHLLAYCQMLLRDVDRLEDAFKRTDVMPLGASALAGTTYPLDREYVREQLGFSRLTDNSMDAVSDRDYVIELSFVLSMVMMHLSRFSEELIIWNTNEFSFVEMDDAFSTGSSIMPQKKNPDILELVRGKTGRTYGSLMTLLTVMKAQPLCYNKDMQEDKQAIFDCVDTVKGCLQVLIPLVKTITFNKKNMRKKAANGYSNATDLADYLVRKGLPFRDAHDVSGKLVYYAIAQKKPLEQLSISEFLDFCPLFGEDVYEALELENCVDRRSVHGGPSVQAVSEQIQRIKNSII